MPLGGINVRIGVEIDAFIDMSHPILDLIKTLADSEKSEIILILHKEIPEPISETLNIRAQTLHFEEIDILNLDLDIYFTKNSELLYQIQKKGILGGYINQDSMECQVAFDHRLFMDEMTYKAMGSWLQILGNVQKQKKIKIEVSLITTKNYSVEAWIKDLFQNSNCRIDLVCFLGAGGKPEILNFFTPCVYFEGEKRGTMIARVEERPLFFI